jgi:hypothetical protein
MTNAPDRQEICRRCGSVYRIRSETTGERERGAVECEVCGRNVIRWNGTTRYDVTLVKQGTPPAKRR